jgi:hypothetical protein
MTLARVIFISVGPSSPTDFLAGILFLGITFVIEIADQEFETSVIGAPPE